MGRSHQCYIPSFVKIGLPVLEKIFEGFLPYMGLSAILVMWPRCREQTFVPPPQGGSTKNLALIGQAVSGKKMFKIVDDDGRRTDAGPWAYYKLAMSLRLRWAKKSWLCLPFLPIDSPSNLSVFIHKGLNSRCYISLINSIIAIYWISKTNYFMLFHV